MSGSGITLLGVVIFAVEIGSRLGHGVHSSSRVKLNEIWEL